MTQRILTCVCPTMNKEKTPMPCGIGVSVRIVGLRAQNEGAEIAVRVELAAEDANEVRKLVISAEQYCELRLAKGEIDRELFDRLEAAAELHQAVRRGEYLLSFGANTERTLARKLTHRGFDRARAVQAAEMLKQRGLIDEASELAREVERCAKKLWGEGRIRAHLWSKGYDRDSMEQLPALLSGIDFVENCARLLQKKYRELPTDPAELRRLTASLARYGYSLSQVKEAMRIVKIGE